MFPTPHAASTKKSGMSWHEEALAMDCENEATRIEAFIREQEKALGRSGAVLGLSGGIDSALVATLAARALGPKKVLALIMPDRTSAAESKRDARVLAKELGIGFEVHSITAILKRVGTYGIFGPLVAITPRSMLARLVQARQQEFVRSNGELPFLASLGGELTPDLAAAKAYCNSKHRVRMVLTYLHAERLNAMVLGTSNHTESALGYFVRYGDDTGDISPIRHLYKTQVLRLAESLGVPRAIVDKAPSPDLMPGVTDETDLGLPYSTLDVVLAGLEAGREQDEIARVAHVAATAVESVRLMRERSERKRNEPIGVLEPWLRAQ